MSTINPWLKCSEDFGKRRLRMKCSLSEATHECDDDSGPRSKSESNNDSEATHEEEHANSCERAPVDLPLHTAAANAQRKSTVSLKFKRLDIKREKYWPRLRP